MIQLKSMSFEEDLKIFAAMLNVFLKKLNSWKSWKVEKLKITKLKELKKLNILIVEGMLKL